MKEITYTLNNGETFTERELRHFFARTREWERDLKKLLTEQQNFIDANNKRLTYDISVRPDAAEVSADNSKIYQNFSYGITLLLKEQPTLATVQSEMETSNELPQ